MSTEAFEAFKNLAEGISALAVSLAAAWGVTKYSTASKAETRASKTLEIETELNISERFDNLMRIAEGFGGVSGPVGLASQRAAIRSIVRITGLHPSLRSSALAGLKTLVATPSMDDVRADIRDAISELE
jgi:hypothetical protein